jgi:hypothetical protein
MKSATTKTIGRVARLLQLDVRFVKVIVSDVGAFIFKAQTHKLKLEDNYFRHDCNFQLPAVANNRMAATNCPRATTALHFGASSSQRYPH